MDHRVLKAIVTACVVFYCWARATNKLEGYNSLWKLVAAVTAMAFVTNAFWPQSKSSSETLEQRIEKWQGDKPASAGRQLPYDLEFLKREGREKEEGFPYRTLIPVMPLPAE